MAANPFDPNACFHVEAIPTYLNPKNERWLYCPKCGLKWKPKATNQYTSVMFDWEN